MESIAKQSRRPWGVGAITILGLGLALRLSRHTNVWLLTVSVSLVVIGAAVYKNELLLKRARTAKPLKPLTFGLLTGAALSLVTLWLFAPVAEQFPEVRVQVTRLYASIAVPPALPWSLVLLVVVVLAEELAFREVLLIPLVERFGAASGGALCTMLYALPQLGADGWVMVPLAVFLGAFWTMQRLLSGSLLVPLTTHVVWSALILELFPLVH